MGTWHEWDYGMMDGAYGTSTTSRPIGRARNSVTIVWMNAWDQRTVHASMRRYVQSCAYTLALDRHARFAGPFDKGRVLFSLHENWKSFAQMARVRV